MPRPTSNLNKTGNPPRRKAPNQTMSLAGTHIQAGFAAPHRDSEMLEIVGFVEDFEEELEQSAENPDRT